MAEAKHTQADMTAHVGAVLATVNGCRMYLASCTCNDLPADEQESNAKLFAAAPDLLAACRDAAHLLRRMGGTNHDPEYSQLIDALRKAGDPV